MKRDMDLVRELALWLEANEEHGLRKPHDINIEGYSTDQVSYNLARMYEAGLISGEALRSRSTPERLIEVWPFNLSWEGHEFVDSVRDPEIWAKTKAGAKAAGGFTLDLLKAIAKGLVKKKLEQHTGVEIIL